MHTYQTDVEHCSNMLTDRKLTIAFAESATAGKLAYAFSQTENSGKVLKGGLVCYDACVKEDLLHIPKSIIDAYSPESREVTREMATSMKRLMDAEVLVAVTGLPAPGGSEEPGKPVGTMFYCILIGDRTYDHREVFSGAPDEVIDQCIGHIARSIAQHLEGMPPN